MNKQQLQKQIDDYAEGEEFFAMTYDKHECDQLVKQFDEDTEIPPLTEDEWKEVVRLMNTDDAIWQETYNAFYYYVERTINKRAK